MSSDKPRRVVIVDNDQAVLDLLLVDLELEGFDIVATAMTGEAALEMCAEHEPDVLVVDLRLGRGINGLEVARRARRPGRRVVLFTNYVNTEVVAEAEEAGALVVEKGNLRALRRAISG